MCWTGWVRVADSTVTLGIDTASDELSLAILDAGGDVVAARAWRVTTTVSRELLASIDTLLTEAGRARTDIDAIAVDVGPGQYGSVRSGIATAQGLALAFGIPLAGVPRLLTEAWPLLVVGGEPVVAVHDIRGLVAWAAYEASTDGGATELVGPRIDTVEEVIAVAPQPATWCGEVSDALDAALHGRLSAAQDAGRRSGDTVVRTVDEARAATLVRIARATASFGDPGNVDALYLRAPSITRARQ